MCGTDLQDEVKKHAKGGKGTKVLDGWQSPIETWCVSNTRLDKACLLR
jgi:hypothetical protein